MIITVKIDKETIKQLKEAIEKIEIVVENNYPSSIACDEVIKNILTHYNLTGNKRVNLANTKFSDPAEATRNAVACDIEDIIQDIKEKIKQDNLLDKNSKN